jgi:hypothetical protein
MGPATSCPRSGDEQEKEPEITGGPDGPHRGAPGAVAVEIRGGALEGAKGKSITAEQIAETARRAIARRTVDGQVRIAVTIPRALAEQLTARAIAEGRNLEDLAAEMLGATYRNPDD